MSKHLHNLSLILSASLLIFTATMLRGTIAKISDHFTKQKVSARKPFSDFIDSVETIEKNIRWQEQKVTQEIETNEFFLINYRHKEQNEIQYSGYIHAAYYSEPGSKVPHTPDVCYRQAGAIIKEIGEISIDLSLSGNDSEPVDVTLVRLEKAGVEMVILFCFIAEGQIANSRTKVRLITSRPGNRHTYFCKIESGGIYSMGADPRPHIENAKSLMSKMIPRLLNEYLPTEEMLK